MLTWKVCRVELQRYGFVKGISYKYCVENVNVIRKLLHQQCCFDMWLIGRNVSVRHVAGTNHSRKIDRLILPAVADQFVWRTRGLLDVQRRRIPLEAACNCWGVPIAQLYDRVDRKFVRTAQTILSTVQIIHTCELWRKYLVCHHCWLFYLRYFENQYRYYRYHYRYC